MWSNVEEKISDGAAGLSPSGTPAIVFVGTAEKGVPNKVYSLGKRSNSMSLFGQGTLTEVFSDCQKGMADVSVLAVKAEGDIQGIISPISTNAKEIVIGGSPLFGAKIIIEATSNEEVFLMVNGEKRYLPVLDDRYVVIGETGLSAMLPDDIEKGNRWEFSATSPRASRESLKKAIDAVLELHVPETVFVCQDSGAEDTSYWGVVAEDYFESEHKPVLFVLSSDLAEGDFDSSIADKVAEFSKIDARFVSVLCQPGEIIDGSFRHRRQPMGLLASTLTKCGVAQSIGATRDFAVGNFALPEGWTNVHSRALDEARLLTLRTYAGLNGIFWSNGRTLAGDTSDYRFIEIVRVVHKAIRLARRASLPYIHAPGDDIGVGNLLAEIRSALTKMTGLSELVDFEVEAPEGQDVANNGVQVEIVLFGVPIIRKIVLNFAFKYEEK
ncbi:MAG: DUF2586 family protein [Brevinema sp.]